MHSIKASWVGQTFALAKCNESEGRKTRIRRSKEERKAMVQDFIKKYQKSNNGSFPSLNLTHKEVGGSFYTVREIVRDLIQENRVLGPGKLALEDQGIDQIFKQDTYDSDASDPQSFLTISSIESHIGPTDLQVSNGIPLSHEPTINRSQIDVMQNDSYELVRIESLVNESIEAEEHSEELLSNLATDHIVEKEKNSEGSVITIATDSAVEKEKNGEQESKATKTKDNPVGSDVVVETETNSEHNLKELLSNLATDHIVEKEKNSEGSVITIATDSAVEKEKNGEQESKATKTKDNPVGSDVVVETETNSERNLKVKMERITPIDADVVVETFPLRVVTSSTDIFHQDSDEVMKMTGALEDLEIEVLGENDEVSETKITLEKSSDSMDCQTTTLASPSLGMTSDLAEEETLKKYVDLQMESLKIGGHNGVQVNLVENDILPSKSLVQGEATDEAKVVNGLSNIENEAKGNIHHSNELERETNPTLDRINLESWEGNSKSRAEEEKNHVLAFFKAFLSAFSQFWSDFSRV